MKRIHPYILEMTQKSYARENVTGVPLVDCSLGVNPYGIPKQVIESLQKIPENVINQYPHDSTVVDKIIEKYQTVVSLTREHISLGNGSFDMLKKVNRLFLDAEKSVLGYLPQFSAYVDDIHCIGANYVAYLLDKEKKYCFNVDEFLECFKHSDVSLLIIENPNNPTGQIIPIEEIEKIVIAAQKRSVFVLIDEAYGDYMPLENSSAVLVNKYSNVGVARSFSKGYGMAGIRFGYLIASRGIHTVLKKVSSPYDCNSLARVLAAKILEDKNYCTSIMERVKKDKQAVISSIKKLKIAHTSMTTPIMLLYCEDESIDLSQILLEEGIDTICGLAFDNLKQNSVRMMMCDNTPLLIELLMKVEEKLKC